MKQRVFLFILAVALCGPVPVYGSGTDEPAPIEVGETDVVEKDLVPREYRNLSLDDCIKLALERNESLRASGYEIEAAQNQVTETKAAFWPVLEYKYRMAPVPTEVNDAFNRFFEGQLTLFNGIHIGIGVPITTFGQLHTAKRMAEGGLAAAKHNETKAREATIFQVKKIYYGILLANETIKLLGEAIDRINEKLEEEEGKEDKELDPYDLLQMKVFRVDMERRLQEARHNLELAYEGMRLHLGLQPGVTINLDRENLLPVSISLASFERYVNAAEEAKPEFDLLDIGVSTKMRQQRLEKYKLMPKLGFGFFVDVGRTTGAITGLQLTDDFNNPFNYTRAGLGLQLEGEIDFHRAYARIKKARAEYLRATYDRQIARKALALDVRKTYLEAKRSQEDVRRAKDAQSLAQQMMFFSKLNLDTGLGEREKYAEALKLVLLTRGQYFKSIFDYNVAVASLAQQVGMTKHRELSGGMDVHYDDVLSEDDLSTGRPIDIEERYDEKVGDFYDEGIKDVEMRELD